MCDTWHLFDSILPKEFGIDTFNLIKIYLQSMCFSKTESQFEQAYAKGMKILQEKTSRNENHEVLVHLNEGDIFGNSYCETPHTLVKDLFFCQKNILITGTVYFTMDLYNWM